jgi:hypothetical protein
VVEHGGIVEQQRVGDVGVAAVDPLSRVWSVEQPLTAARSATSAGAHRPNTRVRLAPVRATV